MTAQLTAAPADLLELLATDRPSITDAVPAQPSRDTVDATGAAPEVLKPGWLDARPLIEAIEARGGLGGCGIRVNAGDISQADRTYYSRLCRSYHRACENGTLTVFAADTLAIKALGVHPVTVWGESWFEAIDVETAPPSADPELEADPATMAAWAREMGARAA